MLVVRRGSGVVRCGSISSVEAEMPAIPLGQTGQIKPGGVVRCIGCNIDSIHQIGIWLVTTHQPGKLSGFSRPIHLPWTGAMEAATRQMRAARMVKSIDPEAGMLMPEVDQCLCVLKQQFVAV